MAKQATNGQAMGNLRHGPEPTEASQPIHHLMANFTEVPNEIWDLELPGLTTEIRWTLLFLARETIGRAFERGGSPYDFVVIPWERWMKALDLLSEEEVQERLTRMEALGLIDVLASGPGSSEVQSNAYQLRWENDGQRVPRTYHPVSRSQA